MTPRATFYRPRDALCWLSWCTERWRVKSIRNVSGPDGETHMEGAALPHRTDVLGESVPPLRLSPLLQGAGSSSWRQPWTRHGDSAGAAPETTRDGAGRRIESGGVLLAEDVMGEGHRRRHIGSELRYGRSLLAQPQCRAAASASACLGCSELLPRPPVIGV